MNRSKLLLTILAFIGVIMIVMGSMNSILPPVLTGIGFLILTLFLWPRGNEL